MRILFLPGYFTPENAASIYLDENRNEAFSKAGFDMLLYTPLPTRGISHQVRKEYKKRRKETFYDGLLTVHRFYMFREGKNPLFRAIRYSLCSFVQFYKGCFTKHIDVMFISSTPPIQGVMAAMIKKIKKIPFVYNLQDIFPDSLTGTGLINNGTLLWKFCRKIENFTYRHADRIIVISEDFKKNIMAKGVPEEKIIVIYNWVDEEKVVNIERNSNILFDKYHLDRSKFIISYCGNIGLTQNMDMLLEVAKELESFSDIVFVLIGEGAYKSEVESIIKAKSITNVMLLPFQPYSEISHVFSLGDVGLVISKPGVGNNSVPSKTWSIMSAERAVLASFDENELKQIITENHTGVFTKAGDRKVFRNAILTLYGEREKCREYGKNGRAFILKNLTRENGTSKYVKIINQFKRSV